jgi:O-antigen/teichoic acid export membrane protein
VTTEQQQLAPVASFRNNLAARLVADTYGLLTSFIAATITARVLGPSGRGYYATLVLLTVLLVQMFNAGLGEAVVVLVGRGKARADTAISATLAAILPLSIVGALALVLVGSLALHVVTFNDKLALLLGGLVVLANTFATTIAWFLVSQEKIVLLAMLNIFSATVTTVGVYVLVAGVHLETSGAMLATGIGCVAILVPLLGAIRRAGLSFKPAWNQEYLRTAIRFGAVVQLANLLVQMTGRLDLVFVYRIAGSAPAGRYSVALTLGALVGSIPMALAFASFPRLPRLSDEGAATFIASLFRIGVAASIACTLVFGVLSPFFLPLVFGSPYRGAIAPTLMLLPGGIFWSGQWILCRAAAARGEPRSLFVSFTLSFVVMVTFDLILIAPFGINGAAAASLASSVVGAVIAVGYYLRAGGPWRPLIPGPRDVARFVTTVREMIVAARGRTFREGMAGAVASAEASASAPE